MIVDQSNKHEMLRYSFNRQSIAVLSMLKKTPLRYSELMRRFNMPKSMSGYFAHYIRNLKNFGLIINSRQTGAYIISNKGSLVLKTWDLFNEKFITDNKYQICHNSDGSNQHEFFKMCKSCGVIVYPKGVKEGL